MTSKPEVMGSISKTLVDDTLIITLSRQAADIIKAGDGTLQLTVSKSEIERAFEQGTPYAIPVMGTVRKSVME